MLHTQTMAQPSCGQPDLPVYTNTMWCMIVPAAASLYVGSQPHTLVCLLANTLLDLPLQLLMSTLLTVMVDGSVTTTSCGKRPVVTQQVSGLL